MNCSTHPEAAAVAFCRACGKGLCGECRREAQGTVYCAEHAPGAPSAVSGLSYPAEPPVDTHPRLAFALGLIPGVGAIYNGQYAKGLVHAIIFGLLISILSGESARGREMGLEPVIAILLAAFVFYMAFEAYHTARRRQLGEPVDEFSSVFHPRHGHSSAGPLALIVIGAVFLLNTLGIVEFHYILRFWPVLLIALGINMLHSRISDSGGGKS